MERTISVEEKIRRAEEIYKKRREGTDRQIATVNLNKSKREFKLFRKMIIQLLVCVIIYYIISIIYKSDYVFSDDFTNKTKEILSYDINFLEVYENIKNMIEQFKINDHITQNKIEKEIEESENKQTNQSDILQEKTEPIGAAENTEQLNENKQLSQEDQDIMDIKNTTTFIKPVEGVISSSYGVRENATGSVPKNHTGTDIAVKIGTKIKSATNGEVVISSEEGDYGKHLKIQIEEVSIIYAHCNNLYVKQGDKVVQGQEIAEVGSTGNSTGPHLHFEIRIHEKTVDPQKIIEL